MERGWELFFFDKIMETPKFLFTEGIYQGNYMRNIIYYKSDQSSKNVFFNYDIYDAGFHNVIDGGISFWPEGIVDQNKLYDHISPIELKRLMDYKYIENIPVNNKKQNQRLIQLLNKAEFTDNPIIFILSLKS